MWHKASATLKRCTLKSTLILIRRDISPNPCKRFRATCLAPVPWISRPSSAVSTRSFSLARLQYLCFACQCNTCRLCIHGPVSSAAVDARIRSFVCLPRTFALGISAAHFDRVLKQQAKNAEYSQLSSEVGLNVTQAEAEECMPSPKRRAKSRQHKQCFD